MQELETYSVPIIPATHLTEEVAQQLANDGDQNMWAVPVAPYQNGLFRLPRIRTDCSCWPPTRCIRARIGHSAWQRFMRGPGSTTSTWCGWTRRRPLWRDCRFMTGNGRSEMKIVQLPPITADGVRRLLILATFLEGLEISDESFDLEGWGVKNHECGTVGCAVGWGTLCPELKAEGLTQRGTNLSPCYSPDGENSTVGGWEAVGMFFGMGNVRGQFEDVQTGGYFKELLKAVSQPVHAVLFDSYFYPRGVKRQDVVARIREVAMLASKNLDGATP